MNAIRETAFLANKYTVPIYRRVSNTNQEPTIQASGVLIEIGGDRILVTARHVVEEAAEIKGDPSGSHPGLWLRSNEDKLGFIQIGSGMGAHISSEETGKQDLRDLAVTKLLPSFVARLDKSYDFLRLDKFDPDDLGISQPALYFVYGYASELSGPGVKVFSTTAMAYPTIRRDDLTSQLGQWSPKVNIFLGFEEGDLRDENGTRMKLPNPGGLSGCGVWRIAKAGGRFEKWSREDIRFVGLVHYWERIPSVLIATQARYIVQLIYASYPELRKSISLHFVSRVTSKPATTGHLKTSQPNR